MGAAMACLNHPNPKTNVNQFLQMYCKRPITKDDIVYETIPVSGGFQSTITVNALGGDQFVGEPQPDQKAAEKSAAEQVLNHHQETIMNMPAGKKKKAGGGGAVAAMMPPAKKQKTEDAEDEGIGEEAAPEAAPSVVSAAAVLGEVNSNKVALNTICMKILRRAMTKGEIVWDTQKVASGYQCTCSVPSLPGEYATTGFTGDVMEKSKDAEQSAAGYAVETLLADPELAQLMASPGAQQNKAKAGGWGAPKGKGKGKGGGKGKKGKQEMMQMMQQMMAMQGMA